MNPRPGYVFDIGDAYVLVLEVSELGVLCENRDSCLVWFNFRAKGPKPVLDIPTTGTAKRMVKDGGVWRSGFTVSVGAEWLT